MHAGEASFRGTLTVFVANKTLLDDEVLVVGQAGNVTRNFDNAVVTGSYHSFRLCLYFRSHGVIISVCHLTFIVMRIKYIVLFVFAFGI